MVLTFIFSTYFTKVIAPNEIVGTSLWSRGLTISGLLVALLSPFMGALADSGGYRKRFLLALTTIGVIGTAMLYTAQSGEVMKALLWFVIANIGVEMAMVFYNAFLPDIAPSSKMGRVSGYGWSFGYVGGLLAMLLAMTGFIEADTPWFGFSKENGEHIRATNLLVAAWLAVFSIPLFVWVKEKKQLTVKLERVFVSTIRQMMNTATDLRRHRQIVRLLAARLFYNDGILTIFSFGGIYAAGTFGFTFSEILTFGIVLNITAGLGAFALGFLDDVIGGKKTILISNLAFIVATLVAVLAPSKAWFWVAGIMVGTFSGPNQAASRSLMGRFVPANKENEFFGFYAFSGKATAFMGPLFLGILTEVFQNQRAGVAVVLVFFVIGSLILLSVDEKDGRASAGRE